MNELTLLIDQKVGDETVTFGVPVSGARVVGGGSGNDGGNVQVGKIVSVTEAVSGELQQLYFAGGPMSSAGWFYSMGYGSIEYDIFPAWTGQEYTNEPKTLRVKNGPAEDVGNILLSWNSTASNTTIIVLDGPVFTAPIVLYDTDDAPWPGTITMVPNPVGGGSQASINFSPFGSDGLLSGAILGVDDCLSPDPALGDTATLTTHEGRTYAVILRRTDGSEPDQDLPPLSGVTTPVTVSGSGQWLGGYKTEGFPPQIMPGHRQVSLSLYSPLLMDSGATITITAKTPSVITASKIPNNNYTSVYVQEVYSDQSQHIQPIPFEIPITLTLSKVGFSYSKSFLITFRSVQYDPGGQSSFASFPAQTINVPIEILT